MNKVQFLLQNAFLILNCAIFKLCVSASLHDELFWAASLEIPEPVLQTGSRGTAVVALQDALKLRNIDVGTSDGAFGPKTEAGVKKLQTRKPNLAIDGIYNSETRDLLESLFQA